jgi:CheY-like chemotaxis protein
MKDYYASLEVLPTATQEEIKEQYYFLIQAWHPDKFRSSQQKAKAEEKSKELNIAYSVLKDVVKRAEYDRKLSGRPSQSGKVERQRPTEESRPHKSAYAEQPRSSYDQQQKERAEEERLRADREANDVAQEEWIRYFFKQARRRQSGQPPANANNSHPLPIRVLVVDDDADTRTHTRRLLGNEKDIQVVGEASGSAEAVQKFDFLLPDVTTICISMPIMGGITATQSICRTHPLAKVIMIGVQNSTNYIRQARMAGACDYLAKPPKDEELKSAIRLAAERAAVNR